jgi:hypothetical protein
MVCKAILAILFLLVSETFARLGDRWGTNIHWTSETQAGEAAMLSRGFRLARMDLTWTTVESVCGKYNFSAYDILLQQMVAHKIRPYWILDYANPCYPGTVWPACDTVSCIAGYGRFAAAVADHYKGQNIIFESVNEPNGMGWDNATDIVALCRAAYPAFAAAGSLFVGPALSTFDPPYMTAAVQAGLLNYVMAVSVHPYPASAPETTLDDFRNLFALIAQYAPKNRTLEVYDGEWGYTSATPPCFYGNRRDPITQGKYVARMWLVTTLAGTSISISYDWHDDGPDPTQCEQNFGSVYFNATGNRSEPFLPKPAYLAAVTMQNGLGNTEAFAGRIQPKTVFPSSLMPSRDVFILKFKGGLVNHTDSVSFAVWHNSSNVNATVNVTFSVAGSYPSCWRVIDTFGTLLDSKKCALPDGTVGLAVTDGPAYLLPSNG